MTSRRRRSASAVGVGDRPQQQGASALSLPPAELLSFLKETRGAAGWRVQDLAKTLNVSTAVARQVTVFLEAQGYVERSGRDQFLTTAAGHVVSGSKPPRFTLESVAGALSELAERIKALNQDRVAPFEIATAVAFGDSLAGRDRAQAPDVGVRLVRRSFAAGDPGSAVEQSVQTKFLHQLKGKRSILSIRPYAEWMSSRAHRKLR